MSLPVVAIVGRPNVGKSSLLNALVGRVISIVDPRPGVTRDRIAVPCPLGPGEDARYIELVDTGGMGIEDADQLTEDVENQIAFAMGTAALILFVVDARDGATPLDRHVAQRLRKQNKPVLLIANKADTVDVSGEVHELSSLGFGEPMLVSAAHGLGRRELLEIIAERLGDTAAGRPPDVMRLAVVGKRNAGKSTFINALAGENRVIVSEKPGTTRDSVDVTVEMDGKTFTLIDTAGLRKRKSLDGDIEFYSYQRAMGSIRRCDVALLMIDSTVPISQVDKGLAGELADLFKPVVLVVNKWDLARDKAQADDYREYLDKMLPELTYAPMTLTTAREGVNVRETVRLAEELYVQSYTRVGTSQINQAVADVVALRGPSHKGGTKPPRLYYAAQIDTAPPTIVCFVNDLRSFDHTYERFLLNHLRQRLPFGEVPIRIIFRPRRRTEKD